MPTALAKKPTETLAILDALTFVRANVGIFILLSALMLVPCFWHKHIEAGDLGSHTYNAWLSQLIAKGQAPGLYIAPQWNNILFDVSLLHLGSLFGLAAAEKIVVCAAVLIFFWGAFSFLAVVTTKPPWLFTPCIAMLAYGYAFSMGFINYYLSIGLACFVLAILWPAGASHRQAGNWIVAAPIAALALIAHPLGFLWLSSTLAYVFLWQRIPVLWRLVFPAGALAALAGLHVYVTHHASLRASWRQDHFYMRNGADQLLFYGHRYVTLSYAALAWGVLCFAVSMISPAQSREAGYRPLRLTLELYAVALCVTTLVPENVHTSFYASWIGLLVSRLTLVSAILGLAALNSVRGRNWFFVGFAACAAVFFMFLFQDTRALNLLEDNADHLAALLPAGTRIVPVVNAPSGWRASFIFHEVERACIGRCFAYSNYEPSSLEFRVRVQPGSGIVMSLSTDAEDVASGDYVVQDTDPPLTAIYQCDESNFTTLCAVPLQVGETVETPVIEVGDR